MRRVKNLHEFVKNQQTDVDALRKRYDMITNGVFELIASIRKFLGNLSHNIVGYDIACADDHVEISWVKEPSKRI